MRIVVFGSTIFSLVLGCIFLKDGHKVVLFENKNDGESNSFIVNFPLKILLEQIDLWNENLFQKIHFLNDSIFNENYETNFNGQEFPFYSCPRNIISKILIDQFLDLNGKFISQNEYKIIEILPVKQISKIISEITIQTNEENEIKFLGDLIFCFDEQIQSFLNLKYYNFSKKYFDSFISEELTSRNLNLTSIEIYLKKSNIEIQVPLSDQYTSKIIISNKKTSNQIKFINSIRNEKFHHLLVLNDCKYGSIHPILKDHVNSFEVFLLLKHLKIENKIEISLKQFEKEFEIYLKFVQNYTQKHITNIHNFSISKIIFSNLSQNVSKLFQSNSIYFHQLLGFDSKIYHQNLDLNIIPMEIEPRKLLKNVVNRSIKNTEIKQNEKLELLKKDPIKIPSSSLLIENRKKTEIEVKDINEKSSSQKKQKLKNLSEQERLKIFLNQIFPDI
eukprot:gene12508-6256_t